VRRLGVGCPVCWIQLFAMGHIFRSLYGNNIDIGFGVALEAGVVAGVVVVVAVVVNIPEVASAYAGGASAARFVERNIIRTV